MAREQFVKRLVIVQNTHFLCHFMQTSRKEFGEPQQFAGHSMQVRKQEMGKLLSHDMENARVDNCSQTVITVPKLWIYRCY